MSSHLEYANRRRSATCHRHTWRPISSAIRWALVAVAGLPFAALQGQVQKAVPAPMDSVLLARAESLSVGDYCAALQLVLASSSVRATLGEELDASERNESLICDPRIRRTTLRELLGDLRVSVAATARLSTAGAMSAAPSVIASMDEVYRVTRSDRLRPVIRAAIGDTLNTRFVRVTETAKALLRRDVRYAALARLGRYERKLGLQSARLNGIEVLMNYAAQRWVPGFTPTAANGPSPWEMVASYVPTYVFVVSGKAQTVSASELGIRRYMFGSRFAAPGWRGMLWPAYWSAGVLVAGQGSGTFDWPLPTASQTGFFASWGSLKVGYILRRHGQWLATRQLQFIPMLF